MILDAYGHPIDRLEMRGSLDLMRREFTGAALKWEAQQRLTALRASVGVEPFASGDTITIRKPPRYR